MAHGADEGREVLTKARLAERLFEVVGLNKAEAADFVDNFFEAIRQTLANNEPVKLSGFGNFTLRDKRERPGRNPKTGEEVPVTARRVVTFHAGQKLRARVEVKLISLVPRTPPPPSLPEGPGDEAKLLCVIKFGLA